ncbi:MAG: IclR family transcriptional regulator [Planctomycetota bacterium]|nr:IclR family transcriptional regulator [Planctomycetota bacterium]
MAVAVKQRIQSLDRGLRILEYIAGREKPVRLGELAALLKVEKSSAHRLAGTLADRGYIRRDAESLGYVLHDKVFALAGKSASQRHLHGLARKYLRKLARQTGEMAHLAVRGGDRAVLVDHEFGSNPVGVTTQWGASEPLHCTAIGKALLAGMDKAELKEILTASPLKRYTATTVTTINKLAEQCRQVGQRRLAFDYAEFRENMNCVASPVYGFRGCVVAAIGISGPVEQLNKTATRKAGNFVRDCAMKLSVELGYRPETG